MEPKKSQIAKMKIQVDASEMKRTLGDLEKRIRRSIKLAKELKAVLSGL